LRQHSRRRFGQKAASLAKTIDTEMSQLDRRRTAVLEAASKSSPFPSRTSIPMHLIYPLLATSWASAMAACAKRIEDLAQQEEGSQSASALRSFGDRLADGLNPRTQFQHVLNLRLKFYAIVRNTVSIFVSFVIGRYYMKNSSTMAGTLALLLIRAPGRVVDRNIQRLIAVAMSSSLPMCIVWLLDNCVITQCGSWGRTIAQEFAIWGFVSIFLYIYYSDTQWAFPAVLIAGLGISPLMKTCPDISGQDVLAAFDAQKQVVFALAIQMVVDTVIMWGHTPPIVAEKRFRQVGDIILDRYGRLFDSDPTAVTLDSVAELEETLSRERHVHRLSLHQTEEDYRRNIVTWGQLRHDFEHYLLRNSTAALAFLHVKTGTGNARGHSTFKPSSKAHNGLQTFDEIL